MPGGNNKSVRRYKDVYINVSKCNYRTHDFTAVDDQNISFIYRSHHDMNYKSLSQVTAESE